jgi:hypothetical protein
MEVLGVGLEVTRQVGDLGSKESDLHLGRAGILVVGPVFGDNFLLLIGFSHSEKLS